MNNNLLFNFALRNQNNNNMKVCIAEKPSVASEIAKVLGARTKKEGYFEGNGYQVTWTFGHLCRLKSPELYYPTWKKWSMESIPLLPPKYEIELIPDSGVKKQFKIIKELFKKADTIINCGDAGQEGELIQRWVMQLASVRCPVQRLWISSLTEDAIREGFNRLRPAKEYDSLFYAGEARAEGDWLLGMNATRLYTLKYGGGKQVLSVGRVQTPTLAMVVERDNQIENFKSTPYWEVVTKYRNVEFACTSGKFEKKDDAQRCLEIACASDFVVTKIEKKKGSEAPPQLYDLTSLQVDCNRKFGMSAEMTLRNIQSLYEKKLTTYPRVDTRFLPDDIYNKCTSILKGLQGCEAFAESLVSRPLVKNKRVFDNTKVTDHHAIIPTGDERNKSSLNQYESKVYEIICKRFIAVFYPAMEYDKTNVFGTTGDITFKAIGKIITNPGWKVIYSKENLEDEDETSKEQSKDVVLPNFSLSERGNHLPEIKEKQTTPPARYTEASLLQAMETAGKFVEDETLKEVLKENGIGRPSSRASIIEILIKREYIKREKKKIISTSIGRNLIKVIDAKMLKSPELTGQWERKLREIEYGRYSSESFMDELSHQLVEITKAVKEKKDEVKFFSSVVTPVSFHKNYPSPTKKQTIKKIKAGDKCPICGKGYVRRGPYGLFCSEYKSTGCKYKGK